MTAAADQPVLDPPDIRVRPRSVHRAARHGHTVPEREWSPLGTLDSGVIGRVDGAGSVQLDGARWSLDWWIGAEDRWHHPSREASVRQRCVGGSPVVETAVRVPGGDVVSRSYAVQANAGDWRGTAVVVEVENRTAVPVALAFVVRPWVLDGPGALGSVSSEGSTVTVDDGRRVLLARDPARTVVDTGDRVAARLEAGDDDHGPAGATSEKDDLDAAFIVPLTHTAVARVLLPVGAGSGDAVPTGPWSAPDLDAVVAGWSAHRRAGTGGDEPSVSLPEPDWDDALEWAGSVLRVAGPDEVGSCLDRHRRVPNGPSAAVRSAEVTEALARLSAPDASVPVARGLAEALRLGGEVRLGDRTDGTVALLHAVGAVLAGQTVPDSEVAQEFVSPAAVAIRRLRKGRGLAADDDVTGLRSSAVRALGRVAAALDRLGQPEVAADARSVANALAAAASAVPTAASGTGPNASGAEPGVRSPLETALAARSALRRGDGAVALANLRSAWSGRVGSGRSDAELRPGEDGPEHPVGVLGFDVAELAARTNALIDLLVTDGPEGPALLTAWDQTWAGQPIEAHHLPSAWGPTSFAVRWHGDRPALLWEVDSGGGDQPVLTAVGIDPAWVGRGAEGEGLLEAPRVESVVQIRTGGIRRRGSSG